MADKIITLTIPSAKVQRVIDATKFLHKIPQIDNPDFVTVEATPNEEPRINEFTDNQWAKEAWRRYIINQVRRYETHQAKDAVSIEADDSLVS